MKEEKYIVAKNNNQNLFLEEVNQLIEKGYRPVGEMKHGFFQDYFYMQAMVKID